MILADTSVWVDHLRRGNSQLAELLEAAQVSCHQFVIGELACGNLRKRAQILEHLSRLPLVDTLAHGEVMEMVRRRRLMGSGIGWVDAHLLAASLVEDVSLWTLDRSLGAVARRLGISAVA
ncbi:MAG: PIN domain-containing protein [Gemmatimonadetes bacterium]|nr:PIN domain-containing protein [Gemmatimonadota bacterium]